MRDFYGKYRGKVRNNLDPSKLGRIQVSVPSVLGEGRFCWAMPCVPYAGPMVGFFAIPPIGANVWVEFEGGDPNYPIWSGCFWGPLEVPETQTQIKILKTEGIALKFDDLPGDGGFTLEVNPPVVPTPLKLEFNASGIKISNGTSTIKLSLTSVSINDGALEVF